MFYLMLPFLAPLILLTVAGQSLRNPGRRPGSLPKLTEAADFAAFLIAAISAVLSSPGGICAATTDTGSV